jgi:polysaccharide export outer membrane protein
LLHRTRISNQNYWKTNVISISDFSDQKFIDKIQPRDQIFVFTDTFIKDLSLRGIISAEDDKNTDSDPNNEIMIADDVYKKSSADVTPRNSLIKRKKSSESDNFNLEEIIKLLKSYARFIGGAVGTPGSYPAANTISLSQLIDVAGGLTADADLQQVSITKFKIEKGRVVRDKVEKLDLKRTPDNQIVLSGMYNILIPPFINDVTTGVITLVGEVERPGQYVIGRDETLHKLIDRAGGFTSVAYPLGAIFTRESLKATQKEGYDLLARQVEEAILKISQSENKQGVGEQITAVLEYAKQLRQQKVSGRITVNILQDDKSAPVYLQDGDVLMIPKRPGHVSIIGSVQKNTVASYSESKRLSSYLASAGGTNRIADRSLTYIVLPNGESESVDNDSIIPPGSVIVVPPKTHSLSPLNFTETVSRILGNIALSFLAINNAR